MMRKTDRTAVRCIDCAHSELLLYERDGVVIADCKTRGEREVANAKRICEFHDKCDDKDMIKIYEMF